LIFDIFQVKERLLFLTDTASVRVGDEAIVCGLLALSPFVYFSGLFVKSLLVEGLVGVECRRICVLSNYLWLLAGSRVGCWWVDRGIGKCLVVEGKGEGSPTV
jgi:hypothetical protein